MHVLLHYSSWRSNSKYLSPSMCTSTCSYDPNESFDLHPATTSFHPSKLSLDEKEHNNYNQLLSDDFQSSSKDGKN